MGLGRYREVCGRVVSKYGQQGLYIQATFGDRGLHQLPDLRGRVPGRHGISQWGAFRCLSNKGIKGYFKGQDMALWESAQKKAINQGAKKKFQRYGIQMHTMRQLPGDMPGGDQP